jgi:hypothetical protein
MLTVDFDMGGSLVRLWIAAGAAALLLAACVVVCIRSSPRFVRLCAVLLGAMVGAAMTWALLDLIVVRDHDAARRALEGRARDLAARTLEPGSALSCLDGLAGETVEAACEKALFASPASVAAAISYVTARFDLASAMSAYVDNGGKKIDTSFVPLRRALETDRFGFLAHALALRDGCTAENCTALAVLHDARLVRANLSNGTFDGYLGRYTTAWAAPDTPAADAAPDQTSDAPGHPPKKVMVDIDFPSAASIPAVSIMNPEPTGKVAPGVAAAAAANPTPAAAALPSRRPPKPPVSATAAAVPPAPITSDAQADPVWTPAPSTPPPPPTAAAAAPAQLNPFASSR